MPAHSASKWLLVKKTGCHCHRFSFVIYLLFSPLSEPHFRFYQSLAQKEASALKGFQSSVQIKTVIRRTEPGNTLHLNLHDHNWICQSGANLRFVRSIFSPSCWSWRAPGKETGLEAKAMVKIGKRRSNSILEPLLRLPTQFSLIFPLIVAGIFLAGFFLSLSRTVLQKRPKHRSFVVLSTFKVSS